MKKIAIGFDLGTTSVGWSIIDNTDKNNRTIIDMGVRLFDDPQNNSFSDVETRRTARGRRRRIRRLKLRKDELCKLLIEYKIISNEEKFKEYITNPIYDENTDSYYLPVEIKVKGLKEKLATNELVLILHNYIKHRGTILTIDDDNEEKEDREKKSKLEQLKKTYNENLYPCENQYEWFKQTGRVLGNDENQIIPNHKYQDEIRKILSNSNIDEDFINKFIDLFKRHRHYSEGPGSERQLSKYGRTQFNDKGQLIWKGGNLWDNLIGKCTYYPNEPRNYKKSPITEVFNLLNDLANLKLKDNDGISFFLTCEEKKEILSITDGSKLTLDKMLKHLGYKKDQIISGLRKDNKDKFLIEELKSCREIMKWFREELGQETSLLNDRNLYSNIFDAGVNYQNTEDRTKHLKEFFKNSSNETLNKINDDKIAKLAELKFWSAGTSSLSKKAQNEFIEYALKKEGESNSNQTKNQMTFFDEHHQSDKNKFSKYKYFPENLYKDEIMPSTVKRTFNQAIKVLNSIMKNKKYKDYEISNIVIEMARDLNSEDDKKAIDKLNKDNKERLEKLIEHHKVDINKIKKGENKIKFLLWCEQGMCDVYDGEYINLDDLLSKPNEYHIDHIIPYTYSFTDSLNNKVLTKATNNHEKGSLTPNQWLGGKGKYEEYEERIKKTLDNIGIRMLVSDSQELKQLQNKYKNKKEKFLLYEGEPISDLNGFVNRQLNDTRYISRLFLNNLKDFFNSSKQYKDKKVIINVINGSITNFARNNYFNEKDYQKDEKPDRLLMKKREEYSHHAIDASIICFLGINSKIESLIKNKYLDWDKVTKDDKVCWVNNQTGEVIFDNSNIFKNEEFNKSAKSFEKEMRNYLDKNIKEKFIRFSRMIVSKDNIPLSNETLYSIRKEEKDHKTIYFKITKLDILSTKKDKISNLKKYFGEECKDREKLLCDKNIYDELNKIYLDYLNGNSKNPFINYMESDIIKKELESKNIRTDKVVLNIFNNPIFLRYLRYKDSEINDIKSKFRLKGHNNKAFYDNLNWTSIRLYKDKNGNVLPVYINVLLLKSKNKNGSSILEPDEEKINSILKDKISSNNYIELKRGSCLLKENKLFYVSGGTNNKIEIKYVYKDLEIKTNEKGKVEKKRLFISPEKWNEYKICDVDPLGNVYNIKSVDDIK